jgi:hypothetical protein
VRKRVKESISRKDFEGKREEGIGGVRVGLWGVREEKRIAVKMKKWFGSGVWLNFAIHPLSH